MTNQPDKNSGSNTSGDSTVQQGKGVEIEKKKSYEKDETQQEFIEEANNNTEVANEDPRSTGTL